MYAGKCNEAPDFFFNRFSAGSSSCLYQDLIEQELIEQQNAIGWDHFIQGKLTKEWIHHQYQYAMRYGLLKPLWESWKDFKSRKDYELPFWSAKISWS
jgi:hypothetical protein